MNLDKISKYNRISNSYPEISDNVIAYCYSKRGNGIELQEHFIRCFCETNNKKCTYIFFDSAGSNLIENKPSLQKLLSFNNIDVIVTSLDRLTSDWKELEEIDLICKDNNIKIFGMKEDLFLSQFSNKRKIIDKEMNL